MENTYLGTSVTERLKDRMQWVQRVGEDTIGGAFHLELLEGNDNTHTYTFRAKTHSWMRNVIDTLHGGSCAALADQAMGCVANCLFENEPHAPTSQLQLNFHRPLFAGDDALVAVRVVNISRSMLHLSAEICAVTDPQRLCVSGSAIFFRTKK